MGTPTCRDHAAIQAFFEGIAAFDRVALTPDEVFANGPSLAIRWTERGTAKSGKAVAFPGIDVISPESRPRRIPVRAIPVGAARGAACGESIEQMI